MPNPQQGMKGCLKHLYLSQLGCLSTMLLRTTVIPCPSDLDSPHALVGSHPGQENGKILQKLLHATANWIPSSEGPRKLLSTPHLSPTAARSWSQAFKTSSCLTIKNSVPLRASQTLCACGLQVNSKLGWLLDTPKKSQVVSTSNCTPAFRA
jgi:hypothetical protein